MLEFITCVFNYLALSKSFVNNSDEMDAIGDVGNSVHIANDVKFYGFSSTLWDVDSCNEVLVIKNYGYIVSYLIH